MWQVASQISSSPGCVCPLTQIWFDIVPEGTNSAASLPSVAATRSSSRLTVGSSLKTSSPTSAAFIAARMPGVGLVTVSLRRSIIGSGMLLVAFLVFLGRLLGGLLLGLLRLLLILHEPAPLDLAEVNPVLGVLQLDRGGRLAV